MQVPNTSINIFAAKGLLYPPPERSHRLDRLSFGACLFFPEISKQSVTVLYFWGRHSWHPGEVPVDSNRFDTRWRATGSRASRVLTRDLAGKSKRNLSCRISWQATIISYSAIQFFEMFHNNSQIGIWDSIYIVYIFSKFLCLLSPSFSPMKQTPTNKPAGLPSHPPHSPSPPWDWS